MTVAEIVAWRSVETFALDRISFRDIDHHPLRLHRLGADGLQFLSELLPGGPEGADGDGVGREIYHIRSKLK